MQARIANPAMAVPGALKALVAFAESAVSAGVSRQLLTLLHLRVSQINGCSVCVNLHSGDLKKDGETDERIWAIAAWRETPYFTDAERAALALAESATRLSDRADAVSDEVWEQAAKHFTEQELAALVVSIAAINAFNRLNAATRQVAGTAWS